MDRIHHRRRLVAALIVMLGVGNLIGAPSPVSALSRESSAAAQVDGSCSGALPTGTVVGMAATANDRGYWIANTAGEVVACGDASNFGSLRFVPSHPIVGIAATSDGGGFFLVATDGGVFSFGDARFHGSTGAIILNRPIVGMAVNDRTGGYWLVASDGGIFAFDAPFFGSTGKLEAQPAGRRHGPFDEQRRVLVGGE